jgi:tripartite-type tricarboxylate transporter receptor subunit TctC
MLRWKTVLVIGLCAMMVGVLARADTYPERPVRIIVPYGPGGIADVTMRLVAQNLSTRLGQQFFIENRPGAAGSVGMQTAKEAPADGYTLVMIGGGLTIAKALFNHLPYDIETDFTPISTTGSYGLVIDRKSVV